MNTVKDTRRLLTITQIKKSIQAARGVPEESFVEYRLITLFQTLKKASFLVATKDAVYKILDSTEKKAPMVNWKVDKGTFVESLKGGQVLVKKGAFGDIRFKHRPDKAYKFDQYFFKKDPREVIVKVLGL